MDLTAPRTGPLALLATSPALYLHLWPSLISNGPRMPLSRREFMIAGTAVGAVLGGGVVVPIGLTWSRDGNGQIAAVTARFPDVVVATYTDMAIGEPVTFDYPAEGQPNLAVRLERPVNHGIGPDQDLVAYSSTCTHMGCPVSEFTSEGSILGPCPCHFTVFDLANDGIPAFGQATQNLPRVLIRLEGGEVVAFGVHRPIYGHADPLYGVGVRVLAST